MIGIQGTSTMDEIYHPKSETYHSVKENLGFKMYLKRVIYEIKPKKWLTTYQELHSFEPRVVEVYGIADKTFYMKYINGINLQECINEKYYLQMLDILNNIYIFNQNKSQKFYHIDTKIQNFMVENDVVYLIDPDSFRFFNF